MCGMMWSRCPTITISKEEATEQLARLREQIAAEGAAHGFDAMRRLFNQLASEESDCGSAQNGGEMNAFGPGTHTLVRAAVQCGAPSRHRFVCC